MCTHFIIICPAESLTWDDVCQLWDNDVYTAKDIKNIASLYFEGAELSAVLEVIEKVENDSHTPETMNTDPGIHISKYLGFEGVQNLLEADCDSPSARGKWYFEPARHGLH